MHRRRNHVCRGSWSRITSVRLVHRNVYRFRTTHSERNAPVPSAVRNSRPNTVVLRIQQYEDGR